MRWTDSSTRTWRQIPDVSRRAPGSQMKERPDEPTLSELLRHVAYERIAMTVAYDRFKESGEESVPLFESFLIHARNGYVFLYKKRDDDDTHPNDIFAQDYVAGWSAVPLG